jgi:hypothetical protein
MLVRPGPRMADGARLMARCIADKGNTMMNQRASAIGLAWSAADGRCAGAVGGRGQHRL